MFKVIYGKGPVATGTEAEVCKDIAERQAHGLNKYGTTVADNPLNLHQWLQHAYEESLDFSVYLKRTMQELAKSQSFTVMQIGRLAGEVTLITEDDENGDQENVSDHIQSGDTVVLLVLKKGEVK